jgi:dienelactone hydrolase
VTNVDSLFNIARRTGGFTAAIAFYPGCAGQFGEFSAVRDKEPGSPITGYNGVYKSLAPLLILTGELDDWTPAEPCRQLAERAKAAGQPVDLTIYPGAHHSFDSRTPKVFNEKRRNSNAKGGLGATTEGNAAAWADAVLKVEAFLASHLAEKK